MRGHAVALLLLACTSQAGDGEWERLGEREGIVIERRSVGHSSIRELRLTARSPVPPAVLMATIWRHEEYAQFLPFDPIQKDAAVKILRAMLDRARQKNR